MVVRHVVRDVRFRTTFRRRRSGADETMLTSRGLQQRHQPARTLYPLSRSPEGIRCLLLYSWRALDIWNTRDDGMYPFPSFIKNKDFYVVSPIFVRIIVYLGAAYPATDARS